MRIVKFMIPLVFVGFLSCVQPFDLVSIGTRSSIVVDAAITDEAKTHVIKLSESFAIDTTLNTAIRGATVWIVDQDGNREDLTSGSVGGEYLTSDNFQALPGNDYTLHIILPGGEKLVSRPETLPDPVTLDRIYGRYVTIPSNEEAGEDRGVQFFVDASSESTEPARLRYNWIETYEVRSPYVSRFVFDFEQNLPVRRQDTIHICYRTIPNTELILTTAAGQAENRVQEIPLKFVDQTTQQLSQMYSILVQQFVLSADAHEYYENLEETNEGSGSLSDRQVGTFPGNITSEDNPEELILGYFEVSRFYEERVFFTPSQFDEYVQSPYPLCGISQLDTLTTPELVSEYVEFGKRFGILDQVTDFSWQISSRRCADCKEFGTYEAPDFWPEN
ncbi:MAG: DUF4249 domain-containing protein [Cytophagales bacterium]|nr:DUF4249 domain-containing protein [Cytophagales bacterium]